jgi:hypothetical protein
MLTSPKLYQLQQLHRLDPAAATRAEALMDKAPVTAQIIIRNAMQVVFARLTSPKNILFENLPTFVVNWIESQPVIRPLEEVTICQCEAGPVKIRRDKNDDLRLRIGVATVYVGFWGRDTNHLSSAFHGKWAVSQTAKQNIQRLLDKGDQR